MRIYLFIFQKAIYEERMRELTTLQARFANMQAQMQESVQESAWARQREEGAKAAVAKAQAMAAVNKTEAEQLRKQLQELREIREVCCIIYQYMLCRFLGNLLFLILSCRILSYLIDGRQCSRQQAHSRSHFTTTGQRTAVPQKPTVF